MRLMNDSLVAWLVSCLSWLSRWHTLYGTSSPGGLVTWRQFSANSNFIRAVRSKVRCPLNSATHGCMKNDLTAHPLAPQLQLSDYPSVES